MTKEEDSVIESVDTGGTKKLRIQVAPNHTTYKSVKELEPILELLTYNSEAKEFISSLPYHVITESERRMRELQEKGMAQLLEEGKLLLEAAKEEVRIKWHWPLVAYFHRLEDVIGEINDEVDILLGLKKRKEEEDA